MNRIELTEAVIAVNGNGAHATIRVFRFLDVRAENYDHTWGACSPLWRNDAAVRIGMLFEAVMFMLRTLRIPMERVVHALRAIPECDAFFGD